MTLPAKIAIQLVGPVRHGRRLPGREPLVDEGHPGGAGLFELYYFKFRIRTIPKEEKKSA